MQNSLFSFFEIVPVSLYNDSAFWKKWLPS